MQVRATAFGFVALELTRIRYHEKRVGGTRWFNRREKKFRLLYHAVVSVSFLRFLLRESPPRWGEGGTSKTRASDVVSFRF